MNKKFNKNNSDELELELGLEKEVNIEFDDTTAQQYEQRASSEVIRDENKIIKEYKYCILRKNKPTFEGTLSREEMDQLYRLYSKEGSNLTQRTVSRYFDNFTVAQIKKLFRAFNIYKDSTPFAPHVLEEKELSEVLDLTFKIKEDNYFKKLEEEKVRRTELEYKGLLKKHIELKNSIRDFRSFLVDLDIKVPKFEIRKPSKDSKKYLILYISDMHIGAKVSNRSIYENNFDYAEALNRMKYILENIHSTCENLDITRIIVCNLGDSLDGMNQQTTRGGHLLPQNMDNKEQFSNYLNLMTFLFKSLSSSGQFNEIMYVASDGGNHDGEVGWMANVALEAILKTSNPDIEVVIFDKFIDYFTVENHAFILCHGKDARDMFKNMPLTINDRVENQINEFIDYNGIDTKNIHFIKGDLHQSATTYARKFRYKSVGSFFGSSEWIHKNFGNTLATVDYDILDNNNIYESRIILN